MKQRSARSNYLSNWYFIYRYLFYKWYGYKKRSWSSSFFFL